jgi:hypothetical protein
LNIHQPVIQPESNGLRGSSNTPAGAIPATGVPPPLPSSQKPSGPTWLVIAVIGSACIAVFLIVAVLAVGMILRQRVSSRRVSAAPPPRVQSQPDSRPARLTAPNTRELQSEPGVSWTNDKIPSEPWSIHVLKIDRSRKDLAFYSPHARDKVLGVSLIADQARSVPPEIGRAVAGVNGDFYLRDNPLYAGDPRGLQIVNGELISDPDTVCVWFDANGNPHLDEVKGDFSVTWPDGRKTPFGLNEKRGTNMPVLYTPTYGPSTRSAGGRELILEKEGDSAWLPFQAGQTYRARVRKIQTVGDSFLTAGTMVLSLPPELLTSLPEPKTDTVLEISTFTTPDLKGVKVAIGGGPALIRNGKPSDWSQRSKYERHPRTAVGWNTTHVYLIVVDGRQPRLSAGMKLAELAEYMAGLGCTEAMNMDGGKSAQMWMNGRIMNSPCQGEDTVANSLLVVRKPEAH